MQYFSSDNPILDRAHPRKRREIPEEQEERFARLAALRQELLALLQGDEAALHLLLQLFSGYISLRELAAALGVQPSTVLRNVRRYLERCRWMKAADLALASFFRGEGFTIDTQCGELLPVGSMDGFAVSLAGKGDFFPRMPGGQDIRKYLRRHGHLFAAKKPPRHFFGGWVQDGFHLDITVIAPTLREAMDVAIREKQRCVFDLRNGCDIPVDRFGREAA